MDRAAELRLEIGATGEDPYMQISARNQLKGRVTAVRTDTIMAEVEIAIDAADLTAVITSRSAEHLGLREGDAVTVIIKSTEVMVGKE